MTQIKIFNIVLALENILIALTREIGNGMALVFSI
jgi:hypothetical protein